MSSETSLSIDAGHKEEIHEDFIYDEQATALALDKQRKKGFRIDDILFSVAKNADQLLKGSLSVNDSPVARSISPDSLCSSNNEELRQSPVSFIARNMDISHRKFQHENGYKTLGRLSPSRHIRENYLSMSDNSLKYDEESSGYPNSPTDSKKPRTSFTPDQIQTLEDSFNEKRYLNHTERMLLANELDLTDCQIKTWFQNRRMKMKRQYKEAVEKGYLIPFHPYPFPRYSRLTPAHFAAAPGINSRHFLSEAPSSAYMGGMTNNCTCCVKESYRLVQNPGAPASKNPGKYRQQVSTRHFMPCHSNGPCQKKIEQARHSYIPCYEDERKFIETNRLQCKGETDKSKKSFDI